jgi:hypothetical protein
MALVEGGLGLDEAHGPDGSFQDDVDETVQAYGAVAEPPGVEQGTRRVQTPDEGTEAGAGHGEPRGEGVGHSASFARPA